jgi:DNA replication protein DnaC
MQEIFITVCRECNAQTPPEDGLDFEAKRRYCAHLCPACRSRRWQTICPADFLDTDPARLPRPEKLAEVLAWRYGRQGLLLHGETGKGKSRCAWVIAQREFEAGRGVCAVTSYDLGFKLPGAYTESSAAAMRLIETWMLADLLLLDDPFKSKLTDRAEEAVFEVVDYRASNGKPMILTCNDTGETLLARMSADRGPALLRRLREACRAISFV